MTRTAGDVDFSGGEPPGGTISGGLRLGKDRAVPGAPLHTNFKLGLSTNYLGLFNADFPPQAAFEYTPAYPEQRNNISYGLDNNGVPGYFAIPPAGRTVSAPSPASWRNLT